MFAPQRFTEILRELVRVEAGLAVRFETTSVLELREPRRGRGALRSVEEEVRTLPWNRKGGFRAARLLSLHLARGTPGAEGEEGMAGSRGGVEAWIRGCGPAARSLTNAGLNLRRTLPCAGPRRVQRAAAAIPWFQQRASRQWPRPRGSCCGEGSPRVLSLLGPGDLCGARLGVGHNKACLCFSNPGPSKEI